MLIGMRAQRHTRLLTIAITLGLWAAPAFSAAADQPDEKLEKVPPEEYPIYDRVVEAKFLTSQTKLVIIDRLTVGELRPDLPPPTREFFKEFDFFAGKLQPETVTDFLFKTRRRSRLEARFNFGVRYQFVSDGVLEEPMVFLAPVPAGLTRFDPTRIGVLGFSRVGFNAREDQALVYVGDFRPDGSGAGFLVLLHRVGHEWKITDTEVLWVAREDE